MSSGYERPGDVDDRTVVEERGHRRAVERRRHHDDPQIVAGAPRLPRQRDREIRVDAALVELVEHDGAECRRAADPAGAAQSERPRSRRSSAFADRTGARTGPASRLRAPIVQPRSSAMRCAMARAATRRGCSRITGPSSHERRRHARRLAGAGLGGDDDGARSPQAPSDRVDERIDRKRVEQRTSPGRSRTLRLGVVAPTPTGQLTPVPPRPQ